MVEVSLYRLVKVNETADVWPDEFRQLYLKCEEMPADRVPFGVTADWLDAHGEAELAAAFRWLFKRPDVEITTSSGKYVSLGNIPRLLGYSLGGRHGAGLIGVVAELADKLEELKESLT